MTSGESPVTRSAEAGWFLCYGIAAFAFRLLVSFTIVVFIAGQFFVIGIVLALWAVSLLVIAPLIKLFNFVLFDRALAYHRTRSVSVSLCLLGLIAGSVFLAPLPSATKAQGVLWLSEQAHVQAGTDGVVTEILAEPAAQVLAGQPLLSLSDPLMEARIQVLTAELDELQLLQRAENLTNQLQGALIKDQIDSKQAELALERERADKLVIHSKTEGRFVLHRPGNLLGRYVRQGEPIGYVLDQSSMTVRVAITQPRIGLIHAALDGVDVKLADALHHSLPATLSRRVPAAQQSLPSLVLGTAGGGSIATDPSDDSGLTTTQSVFLLDVTLGEPPSVWRIGQRAYVRFDHGSQPLAQQWYRAGRQLFLREFGV